MRHRRRPLRGLVVIIADIVTFLDRIVVVVVRRLAEQPPPTFERRHQIEHSSTGSEFLPRPYGSHLRVGGLAVGSDAAVRRRHRSPSRGTGRLVERSRHFSPPDGSRQTPASSVGRGRLGDDTPPRSQ